MPEIITTIKSALNWAYSVLEKTSDTGPLDARLLLSDVLDAGQDYLMRYPERVMTTQQTAKFQDLVTQRAAGRPIAYLLGRQGFYDLEFEVTPDVLIPRPETELLIEKALAWAKNRHTFIADVGTGSGAIALTLAKHLPNAHVTGIDISEAALAVAQRNGERLILSSRVRWLQGDLLAPLMAKSETVDLIVANLPYIETQTLDQLDVSKHEPRLALDGGEDGLVLFRRLLEQSPTVLREEGLMLLEIGAGQGAAVKALCQAAFPARTVTVTPDLAGHDRVVSVI